MKTTVSIRLAILCLLAISTPLFICAETDVVDSIHDQLDNKSDQTLLAQKLTTPAKAEKKRKKRKRDTQKTISFNYDSEELIDIIYSVAAQKGVNVILPQGANAITSKITLNIEEKLTLDEAWSLLFTIMDLAGYSLMPKGSFYIIVKNTPTVAREPLPLYIGTNPNNLPDTDQRIRYLYYLSNIKLSDDPANEITQILQTLLPQGATPSYKVDSATNSLIISAKANDIKAVMKIILELDRPDFQETLEVINLKHTTAKLVADLFNESLLKSNVDLNRYRLDAKQQSEAAFFSKFTRVIADERTNSLIVLGRAQAIERVKEFIENYVDLELESGKSILHIYQLLYLDASLMAQLLNDIVKSSREGGTGQASAGQAIGSGPQETFDEVYIRVDKPQGEGAANFSGGNKLVIAAREKDWKVIEKLVQELDKPQPQVLIEVLIADLTLADIRQLGSVLRNPASIPFPGNSAYQDAQIGQGIILSENPPLSNNATLQSDLLRLAYNPDGTPGNTVSDAQFLTPGSTVFSLNDKDGKTWSLLSILQTFANTKIISHPHVIATNNQKAEIELTETRYLDDEATSSGGTTTTIKKKNIPARLCVTITPRISYGGMVLLDVIVDVTDYKNSVDNTRITRKVTTKALVRDKNILALGGLIRLDDSEGLQETPLLSKIPILGYFFKNRNSKINKTNLSIFITPTIIEPRLRAGVDKYTGDYLAIAQKHNIEGGLFDSLRDPITRWFFNVGGESNDMIETFMAKDEFKTDLTEKQREEAAKAAQEKYSPKVKKKKVVASVVPKTIESREDQLKHLIAADNSPLATDVKDQILV